MIKSIRKIVLILSIIFPGFVRVFIMKFLGFKVHSSVRIGLFTMILADDIEIGKYSKIGSFTIIKCDRKLVMKDSAEISSFVLIYGERSLLMDSASYVGPKAVLNVSRDITIGYYSAIGPGSYVFTHGVWLPYTEGYPRKFESVRLKSHVWIPAKVFIGPGVTIGENTIIASGERIFQNVPHNTFFSGSSKRNVPIDIIRDKQPVEKLLVTLLNEFIESLCNLQAFADSKENCTTISFSYKRQFFQFCILPDLQFIPDQLTDYQNKRTYYFLTASEKKNISTDDYGVFCFRPLMCSGCSTSMFKKLRRFFERECGLKFGVNSPLKEYFVH
jgi:acetyltransferase-like isoleucine patch superfamily enzyme